MDIKEKIQAMQRAISNNRKSFKSLDKKEHKNIESARKQMSEMRVRLRALDTDFTPAWYWEHEEYEEFDERLKTLDYYNSFVHLDVNTKYGVGVCEIKELVNAAKDYGMKAVAITDFCSMARIYEFYKEAKESGIKPIIGCKFYLLEKEPAEKETFDDMKKISLIVLALDDEGYKEILKMIYHSDLKYGYDNPHITADDLERLFDYSIDLVGIGSYCLENAPKESINEYLEAKSKLMQACGYALCDNMFVGVKRTCAECEDLIEEKAFIINPWNPNYPSVAINDVCYLYREDYSRYSVSKHITRDNYLKTAEEMKNLFADYDIPIKDTWSIAHQCDCELEDIFKEITDKMVLIKFHHDLSYWKEKLPEGFSDEQLLIDILIPYAKKHFNCNHSAKIITYGKCTAVGAIMQAGKAMDISDDTLERIRNLLPKEMDVKIDDALKRSDELYAMYQDSEIKRLMDSARVIQNSPQNVTTHQSAFVISKEPIEAYLPTRFYEGNPMIEWPISALEDIGIPIVNMGSDFQCNLLFEAEGIEESRR